MTSPAPETARFRFRHLPGGVCLGTASDRYAGWIGQIYSPERWAGRITRRSKSVGGARFVEEVLPVESVAEYFQHFDVLELDFTFYSPLLSAAGEPTRTLHVLRTYRRYLSPADRVFLKVPQAVCARKIRRKGTFETNPAYLDPGTFRLQFYEPAREALGPCLAGFIFEQEYHRREERRPAEIQAEELARFFEAVPTDKRYHMELRTEAYLKPPVFQVWERFGIGQVLSHWTWLPSLWRQHVLGGKIFRSAARDLLVRLMTPRGMRYEQAYARAHPFTRLVEGMMAPGMIPDTLRLVRAALAAGTRPHVIINNRAGGNAPLIARMIAESLRTGD